MGNPEEYPVKRERDGFVAGLFNALFPGLGFLYLGMPIVAVVFHGAFYLLILAAVWSGAVFWSGGFSALIGSMLVLWIVGILCSAWIGLMRPPEFLARSQRWYWYCFFMVVTVSVNAVVIEHRANLFGFEIFSTTSNSMIPTLVLGDRFVSDGRAYRINAPQRGDVVLFESPMNAEIILIQRVVGLPGEVVEVSGKDVRVNGALLEEQYAEFVDSSHKWSPPFSVTVPSEHYFVLADNRNMSIDGRAFGPIPRNSIYGKVRTILYSYNSVRGFQWDRIGVPIDDMSSIVVDGLQVE